jgi:hypothetical protein
VLPEGGEAALERIWVITPGQEDGLLYAGGDPGVLFESRDGGASWEINAALWNHPTRPTWQPGGGGLCAHSIVPWPGDPQRLLVAVSAAGIWLTEDGGRNWRQGNQGLMPRYLPEETRETSIALCVHHVERAPGRPERLFLQFHGGIYRSDDAGESWTEIGQELEADFGFPLAVDPADPDSAFVIPLKADWPSRAPAAATISSSTSAPPRVRCSARATPAPAGSARSRSCRRFSRSQPRAERGRAGRGGMMPPCPISAASTSSASGARR